MQESPKVLYIGTPSGTKPEAGHLAKSAGIARYAEARGWNVVPVAWARDLRRKMPAIIREERPAGCIVECSAALGAWLPPALFAGIPTVWLDCREGVFGPGVPTVVCDQRARMAGKPVIVTEWSFSALDSGLPCTHGAGQRFFTQRERAEATSIFARTMWAMPEVAGYVYFMWCDQPAVGKNGPQGENTNYGLVNADDEPYEEQVAALAALQCHAEASRAAEVPRPREVVPPRGEDFARAMAASHAERESHAESAEGAEFGPAFSGSPCLCVSAINPHAESLVVAGKGVFSAMLREYSRGGVCWTAAVEARVLPPPVPSGGTRDFVFRGAASSGPFEVAMRFYEPAGAPFFLAELLSVRNGGDKPLPFDAVFFRVMPLDREGAEAARGDDAFEPPKEDQPTPIPPMLWRPWRSGAWILPDGTALGLLSPRQTGVQIRFWKDSALHADAEMRYPYRKLAPRRDLGARTPALRHRRHGLGRRVRLARVLQRGQAN